MDEQKDKEPQKPPNGKEWWEDRKNPWATTTFFLLLSLFIFLTLTGAYTYFADSWDVFSQYIIYFHSYFGILFFLLFIGFTYQHLARHFKKTGVASVGLIGGASLFFATIFNHPAIEGGLTILLSLLVAYFIFRTFRGPGKADKKHIAVQGLLGLVLVLLVSLTGLMIIPGAACYKGGRLFYIEHNIAAVLLFVPVTLHLVYFLLKNKKVASPRAKENYALWSGARRQDLRRALIALPVLFVPAVFAGMAYVNNHWQESAAAVSSEKANFSASRLRTPDMEYLQKKKLVDAQSCGTETCHVEITKQWAQSAHHHSGSTKLYKTLIPVVAKQSGMDTVRFCSGCHAPVALLSGELISAADPDSAAHKEGINCIVCHSITDVHENPNNASYTVSVQKDYIYEDERTHKNLHQKIIKLNPRLHRKIWMRELYKTPEYCAACHDQSVAAIAHNYKGFTQNVYSQFMKSRFYDEEDSERSFTCNDCHMPLTDQNFYDDYMHDHRFFAAHQALPVLSPSNKISLYPRVNKHGTLFGQWSLYRNPYAEIPLETLASMWLRGEVHTKELDGKKWPRGPVIGMKIKAPAEIRAGEKVEVFVVSTNRKAGHDFPAGPLDVIETWIELKAMDSSGSVIYHSGFLDAKHHVDRNAHFFVAQYYDKGNTPIKLHEIWNLARVEKRAIHSGKQVTDSYSFKIPESAKGKIKITAKIRYRKCNQFIMDAVYNDGTTLPVTDVSKATAVVKLK